MNTTILTFASITEQPTIIISRSDSPFLNKELAYADKLKRMGDHYSVLPLILERIIKLNNSPEYLQQLDNTYYDIPFPNDIIPAPEVIARQSAEVNLITNKVQLASTA